MINLSNRLSTVASMVSDGGRVVDIGTDHAYIPMYLVSTGRKNQAIAGDVNKGPLAIAAKHIEDNGLSDSVSTCLSNGLDKVAVLPGDSIVIAGMGGLLMKSILANDLAKAGLASELILQPQSEYFELRSFLYEQDFIIIDEKALIEEGKYYFVLKAVKKTDEESKPILNENQLEYGPVLLDKKDSVLKDYLLKQKAIMEKVKEGLNKSQQNPGVIARIQEVDATINKLKMVLEEYYEG